MTRRIRNPRHQPLTLKLEVNPRLLTVEQREQILRSLDTTPRSRPAARTRITPPPRTTKYDPDTWRTKKQRKAGQGFACTVAGKDRCKRKDLRTPLNTGSHVLPDGHFPKL